MLIDNFDADRYDRTFFELLGEVCEADPEQRTNREILDLLCRSGVNILFTTRLFVPPQYPSVCLSDPAHLLSRAELTELAREIYDDHEWTEAEEVMMEEIILSVGKLCTGCLCPGSSGRIAGIRSGVFTAKPGKYKDQDYNQDYQGQFAFFLFHFASSSGKNRIHLTSRCMCGAAVMSNISFRGPALYANTGDWRP